MLVGHWNCNYMGLDNKSSTVHPCWFALAIKNKKTLTILVCSNKYMDKLKSCAYDKLCPFDYSLAYWVGSAPCQKCWEDMGTPTPWNQNDTLLHPPSLALSCQFHHPPQTHRYVEPHVKCYGVEMVMEDHPLVNLTQKEHALVDQLGDHDGVKDKGQKAAEDSYSWTVQSRWDE